MLGADALIVDDGDEDMEPWSCECVDFLDCSDTSVNFSVEF